MNIRFAIPAALAAAFALAPVAHADGDLMYRVGVDIQPGDYVYRVVGNGMGSWMLCPDANCDDPIDMDTVDGMGHTGYLTIPASAKYVKINDLLLTPA